MKFDRRQLSLVCVFVIGGALGLAGCKKDDSSGKMSANTSAASPDKVIIKDAAVDAMLAKADAADGAVDHVVSKCASCNLGMPGNASYLMKVNTYKLHFCSEHCKDGFKEDTKAKILAMAIPED